MIVFVAVVVVVCDYELHVNIRGRETGVGWHHSPKKKKKKRERKKERGGGREGGRNFKIWLHIKVLL